MTILEFLDLFEEFRKPSRRVWRAVIAAMFGLDPGDEWAKAEALLLMRRETWPTTPAPEVWVMAGRRAGKSVAAATIALYFMICKEYALAPGEVPTVMVIAADRKQARVILRYAVGLLAASQFKDWVKHKTLQSLELRTGVVMEIHTASFRSTRGYTCVAALCDEIAFWRNEESAAPDTEILNALRPALMTTGGPLIAIGSGYAKRGELYAAFKDHWGNDASEVLFFKGPSLSFNPTLPQRIIDRAYARDAAAAASEYGGEFRDDVEAFLTRETVDALIVAGRLELPYVRGLRYRAFMDFAGGSGKDSATLAIGYTDKIDGGGVRHVVASLLERRPKFSPDAVCDEFAAKMKAYKVFRGSADRWGGQFPVEAMKKRGIVLELAPKVKSDLYLDFLPVATSAQVELLDHPRLTAQLVGLERRVGRGGKGTVDHPPKGHDDCANAVAGLVVLGGSSGGVRIRRM